MYPDWFVFAGFALTIVFIWLGGLTILTWQQKKFLKSLFPSSGERDIRKKFEEIIKAVEGFKGELSNLDHKVETIQNQGLRHMQRVSLLRFNPYDDTGGDQSFVVCFLDNQGSGVVVTSLHARPGTRLFAKPVIEGKARKYELSKEEEQVIKKAMTSSE